jgi:nicotinic acid mononucleotide adenylyltransferase
MLALLGGRPDQFCSQRTARAMAMAAFRRALAYETTGAPVAGVSCTSSLVTDRPKSGPHRTHIGLQTQEQTAYWSLELNKGARNRAEEEALVDRLVLNALADASQLEDRLELDLLPGEIVATDRASAPRPWQELLLGNVETVRESGAGPGRSDAARGIFPGEFNPLHSGHQRMAELAQQLLGVPVEFEIAITNVEKPPLDYLEMRRRLAQFAPEQTVWFTRAARFTEKSRIFSGATFVVGIDTLRRLVAPRYYHDDPAACRAAIELIISRRCRFLVFGRNLGTGFVGLGDIELPVALKNLCREIPAADFRDDISSTALRRAGQE